MAKKHCHYRTCDGKCHICYDINITIPVSEGGLKKEGRSRGVGPIARGVAAAGIMGAIGSSTNTPPESDTNTLKQWGDSSLRKEEKRQGRDARGGTRDKGSRSGESSQED